MPRKMGRRKGTAPWPARAAITPISGITTAASEKQDKRWANCILRLATHRAVRRSTDPDAAVLPVMREVSNKWSMAKDGRSWFGQRSPKLMRK